MNQMAKSLSFKPINYNITRNKSIGRQQCKKHPKHRQSPGVCSLCLSEKLSKVSTTTTSRSRAAIIKARAKAYYYNNYSSTASSSLSSTSYESSYASSNGGSPLRATMHHRRNFSDVYNNNHAKEGNSNNNNNGGFLFFSKSKSMAHVEKGSYGVNKLRLLDDKENIKKKEKKNVNGVSKIWSNLLGLRRFNNYQKGVNVEGSNHLSQCTSTVVLAS